MVILIALIIGFLSAFVGSLVGLGGGIVFVPAMLMLYQYFDAFSWASAQTIVGISLITMVFTGLSSTLAYMKLKRVDIKTGVLFLFGSIPGSVVGSWVNAQVDVDSFSLYFGILMLIVLALMFIDREKIAKNRELKITDQTRTFVIEGKEFQYNVPVVPAFILSFFVGGLSGMFGIGGGTISVPALILFFGMPVQIAIATSMFMIFFISIMSSISHIALGHIVWGYVIFFIIGSYVGGTVGARTNKRLKGKTLEWILKAVIAFTGFQLIYESLS
ncbi:MAG TPA: sulfite exporter TauE/SafE family protein [Pseudogracilibacillus sp.]|nr:sulfite exporter TauE/SafE family protein [Pseudogracilibacillus sp.]